MGTAPRWHRMTKLMTAAVAGLSFATLPATPQTLQGQEVSWDRLDTLAVLGGGPTWSEPPFYRVFDAVLDHVVTLHYALRESPVNPHNVLNPSVHESKAGSQQTLRGSRMTGFGQFRLVCSVRS